MGKIPVACLVVNSHCPKSRPFRGLKRVKRIFKHPCPGRFGVDLQRRGVIDIRLALAASNLRTGKDPLKIRKDFQSFERGFRILPVAGRGDYHRNLSIPKLLKILPHPLF